MAEAVIRVMFLIMFFISVGNLALLNGQEKYWCVPKPSSEEAVLKANEEYACSQPNVDCKDIQPDGPCHYPNTLINNASVAMNLYYQAYKSGQGASACDFGQSGLLSIKDPSYEDCVYAWIPAN